MDIQIGLTETQTHTVRNVEKICRICLDFGELQPLAYCNVYSTYLLLLPSSNFESDGELPKNICTPCLEELMIVSSFLSKLEKSTSILRKGQIKEDPLKPTSDNVFCETSIEYINETEETVENENKDIGEVLIEYNSNVQEKVDVPPGVIAINDPRKSSIETLINDAKSFKVHVFSCQICGQGFNSEKTLDLHKVLHTEADSDTEEVIQFEVETKSETEKPYICDICTKGFIYELSYMYHMTSHKQAKLCECTYCNWTGMSEFELDEHVKIDHQHKDENSGNEDGNQDLVCRVCGEYFESEKKLEKHLNLHEKKFECKYCSLRFRMKSTLIKHLSQHDVEGIFECPLCDKIVTRKIFLKRHMETVHSKGPAKEPEPIYFCTTCKKGFFFKKNLEKHEDLHKQTPYSPIQEPVYSTCEHCDKKFTHKTNLLRHIRIKHAGLKKYSCKVCNEKFTVKNSLIYHMNIHNNAKPYQCEICSRSFRQPSALHRHTRQVHQTKEKNYMCQICDKLLKSSMSLRAHMKRHEEG